MTTQIDPNTYGPWALVTGASSGIGAEFARTLAGQGLDLVLASRRLERLEEIGRDLSHKFGVRVRTIGVDLSEPGFLDTIRTKTDGLDIGLVISNAGAGEFGPFLELDLEKLDRNLQLNVHAHLQLSHHFGQRLAARGKGGIILVSSTGALQGVPYLANYSAAKAYLVALGEALNYELKATGVDLTVLLPGPTDTPMLYSIDAFDPARMPMKPMTPTDTVQEGLSGLLRHRPVQIAGRMNRFIAGVVPRRRATGLWGGLMERTMKKPDEPSADGAAV